MTASSQLADITLSATAASRLRKPLRRGMFRDLDAARAQLGLLSVADANGQARIYWLVDLNTQVVEDARFLAFGSLASHPTCDRFCERVRGMSVQAACEMPLEVIEADLRDDPATPAFGEAGLEPLVFIRDLQERALAELPSVRILPKPTEVDRYQRKREQDWDDQDRAWLPLSLMKKIMAVQQVASDGLDERLGREVAWEVEGLHDDFQLVVSFSDEVPEDERPTVVRFLEEVLRSRLHPQITVSEATG